MTHCAKGLDAPRRPTSDRYERRLTVAEIEGALDALLGAIAAEDARRAAASTGGSARFKCMSVAELVKTDPDVWRVEDLARDPVGRACREQIKVLGRLLFRVTGSTDAMRETMERVAARDPAHEGRRAVILDKWWSSIGAGADVWWA